MHLGVGLRTDTKKTCFKKIWDYVLQICYHSKLNSQHDQGDLYDHLISTRISTLIMNKIFMGALKIMTKMAMDMIWIYYSSCTNCMFHILLKWV